MVMTIMMMMRLWPPRRVEPESRGDRRWGGENWDGGGGGEVGAEIEVEVEPDAEIRARAAERW